MDLTLFTIFCWAMGALYGLLTLFLGLVWPVFVLWHGAEILDTGEPRYFCLHLGALTVMSGMMSRTCLVATNAEYDTPRWVRLNLAMLVLSLLTVISMAADCWFRGDVEDFVFQSSAVVASVWAMQLLFAWRAYRRYEENESRWEDLHDDD